MPIIWIAHVPRPRGAPADELARFSTCYFPLSGLVLPATVKAARLPQQLPQYRNDIQPNKRTVRIDDRFDVTCNYRRTRINAGGGARESADERRTECPCWQNESLRELHRRHNARGFVGSKFGNRIGPLRLREFIPSDGAKLPHSLSLSPTISTFPPFLYWAICLTPSGFVFLSRRM